MKAPPQHAALPEEVGMPVDAQVASWLPPQATAVRWPAPQTVHGRPVARCIVSEPCSSTLDGKAQSLPCVSTAFVG